MSTAAPRPVRVFVYDARLVLALANHARHLALKRVFGVSRNEANLLTGVFVIGAAEATFATARKALNTRPMSARDASIGALALREAALALGGPAARPVPRFGALVALAAVGGVAFPSARRAAHGARVAEQRIRERRTHTYEAMHRPKPLS
jgi:hypothetical protein